MTELRLSGDDFDFFRLGYEHKRLKGRKRRSGDDLRMLGPDWTGPKYLVVDQISYDRGYLFAGRCAATGYVLESWPAGRFLPPAGARRAYEAAGYLEKI